MLNAQQIERLTDELVKAVGEKYSPPRAVIRSHIRNAVTLARKEAAASGPGGGSLMIESRSIVSGADYRPLVVIEWGEKEAQFSPGDTRDLAERLRRMADAAESDAFIFDFVVNGLGSDPERAAHVMYAFREFREERARKDYDLQPSSGARFVCGHCGEKLRTLQEAESHRCPQTVTPPPSSEAGQQPPTGGTDSSGGQSTAST